MDKAFWTNYLLGCSVAAITGIISFYCHFREYDRFSFSVKVALTAVFSVVFSWIGAGVYLSDIYWLYKDKVLFTIERKKNMKRFFRVRKGKLLQSVAIWPNLHFNWFDSQGVKSKYIQLAFLLWYVEFSYSEVR